MKATEQYIPVVLFIKLYKVVLSFESVGKIPNYDYSNNCYQAVLSRGAVYNVVHSGWVLTLSEFEFRPENLQLAMSKCNKAPGCLALHNASIFFRHSLRHKPEA